MKGTPGLGRQAAVEADSGRGHGTDGRVTSTVTSGRPVASRRRASAPEIDGDDAEASAEGDAAPRNRRPGLAHAQNRSFGGVSRATDAGRRRSSWRWPSIINFTPLRRFDYPPGGTMAFVISSRKPPVKDNRSGTGADESPPSIFRHSSAAAPIGRSLSARRTGCVDDRPSRHRRPLPPRRQPETAGAQPSTSSARRAEGMR